MHSRLFINIGLLAVVIALTLFLANTTNDESVSTDITLTNIDPASVNSITIMRDASGEILFQKENGKWWMQQPYHLAASEFRINTMLGLLKAHSYTQFKTDEVELEQFMLNAPAVSIRFNDTQIDFGDTSPIGEQRYVLVSNTVHLINDSLYEQLQTNAAFFLSTRLLPETAGIKAIQFPGYLVSKNEATWIIEPQQDINAARIAKLVHAWASLDAISLRQYEPGETAGTIKINLESGDTIEFIMVSPPPQLVLARPELGLQYHISGYDSEQLFLQPVTNH